MEKSSTKYNKKIESNSTLKGSNEIYPWYEKVGQCTKSVIVIYYINRIKAKNHTIISTNAKNNLIEYGTVRIKTLNKEYEEKYLNIIKAKYEKPTPDVIPPLRYKNSLCIPFCFRAFSSVSLVCFSLCTSITPT